MLKTAQFVTATTTYALFKKTGGIKAAIKDLHICIFRNFEQRSAFMLTDKGKCLNRKVNNISYSRTPDYTLYSGVHVCWSEHSDSSFVYGFMSLDYGLGTMTATTYLES